MKTNVYVDGFNLYYGCIKGTPYKWLDVGKLCNLLLPKHSINRIRYFTALVQPRHNDPRTLQRQQTYLRALSTIPNLSIHYGHFLTRPRKLPLLNPKSPGSRQAEVLYTEEKGSDVNLATYLLVDGFKRDFELAIIISNDSDLLKPIEVIRRDLQLTVGVISPYKNRSWALYNTANWYRHIRKGVLQASQFPPAITDRHGTITKPNSW